MMELVDVLEGEQLDSLLNAAIARRNVALRQLEAYREGFGRHVRRVSDEVIGEFKELAPASPPEVTTKEAAPTDGQSAVPPAGAPEIATQEAAPMDGPNLVPPAGALEMATKEAAPMEGQRAVPPASSLGETHNV